MMVLNPHLRPTIKGKIVVCPTCKQFVSLVEIDHDLSKKTNRMFDCHNCNIGFWVWTK